MNRDSLSDFACAVAGASAVLAIWEEGNIFFPARLAAGLLLKARARFRAAKDFGENTASFEVYYAEVLKVLSMLAPTKVDPAGDGQLVDDILGFSEAAQVLEDLVACLQNEIVYYTENHAPEEEYVASRS